MRLHRASASRKNSLPKFSPYSIREALVGWLTAEPPRPVLISGTGGVGKSGLCLAALHDPVVAGRFGARRFFVRLDGATSYELMLGELANVLGLEAGPDLERRVFFELGRAPALLALDNAETPWQADSAALERLLGHIAGIAGLTPLLTMRGRRRRRGCRTRSGCRCCRWASCRRRRSSWIARTAASPTIRCCRFCWRTCRGCRWRSS